MHVAYIYIQSCVIIHLDLTLRIALSPLNPRAVGCMYDKNNVYVVVLSRWMFNSFRGQSAISLHLCCMHATKRIVQLYSSSRITCKLLYNYRLIIMELTSRIYVNNYDGTGVNYYA